MNVDLMFDLFLYLHIYIYIHGCGWQYFPPLGGFNKVLTFRSADKLSLNNNQNVTFDNEPECEHFSGCVFLVYLCVFLFGPC